MHRNLRGARTTGLIMTHAYRTRVTATVTTSVRISTFTVLVFLSAWSGRLIATESPHYNPLPMGDSVYLSDNGISRWSMTTGEPLWSRLENRQTFAPVVANGVLYIGGSDGLFAFDAEHGTLKWKITGADTIYTPTVVNGIAYSASQGGELRATTGSSGELLWQRQFPGWIYPPALSGGVLITAGSASILYAISGTDGHLLWQQKLPQEPVHYPVLLNSHHVVVTTFSGDVVAYDIRNGTQIWSRRFSTPAFSSISHKGILYLADMDNTLHALDAGSGEELWRRPLSENIPVTLGSQFRAEGTWLLVTTDQGYIILDNRDGTAVLHACIPGIPSGAPFMHDGQLWVFYQQAEGRGVTALTLKPAVTHTSEQEASP